MGTEFNSDAELQLIERAVGVLIRYPTLEHSGSLKASCSETSVRSTSARYSAGVLCPVGWLARTAEVELHVVGVRPLVEEPRRERRPGLSRKLSPSSRYGRYVRLAFTL